MGLLSLSLCIVPASELRYSTTIENLVIQIQILTTSASRPQVCRHDISKICVFVLRHPQRRRTDSTMAAASVSLLATCRSLSRHSSTSRAVKPLVSVTTRTCKMRVPYELKQGQYRQFHELPSGLRMEVIIQKCSINTDEKLPLVFIHGSFHAAWCWGERWLPFFSQHGFDCYAISLLGQGESDSPAGKVAGTLQTHASNIAHFIREELLLPPVLVGHSFGGLIVQNYIANIRNEQILETGCLLPELAGAVLVCSVPPSGNSGLVWRYLFSKPIAAFKVTRSLAAKAFQTSLPLCRETFFSPQMEDQLVMRYQELMTESSRLPLFDLRLLNASLPVPSILESSIEILVLGAGSDFIVDAEGLKETGRFYGVSPISLEGVAHDIMLDCLWERGANAVLSWLDGLPKSRHLKASSVK